MNKPVSIQKIIQHSDTNELHRFIIDYAGKNTEFRQAFNARFNPTKINSGDKQAYAAMVRAAFANNPFTTRGRYRNWNDYGFDAEGVREELQLMLDKIVWFMESRNFDEAIVICQAMIETIPDEWEVQFDHDGDVQVMYDGAIDRLQEMLDRNVLSKIQKENLFAWYDTESRNNKHEYIGLNTSLKALENYFTDTPEMLQKNLANMDDRINNADSDYRKKDAAMSKIRLLQKAGLNEEAESAIAQYIRFENVRKLRLEKLIKEKQYADALELIQAGISIAIEEKHPGAVISWKEELLTIYKLQKDSDKILLTSEELFYERGGSRKYYDELKKYTPEKDWPATLERLLSKMNNGFFGFNELKADMLIEHKMWERLFALCKKSGAEKLEQYEKYLKSLYAKEIFDAYQRYVEEQALITDQNAYNNVARILKKMKEYEGGGVIVSKLLLKYREVYKRRKNMMKVLGGV